MALYDKIARKAKRIANDPKKLRLAVAVLGLMTSFGILAPETATKLRDATLILLPLIAA